MAFRPIAPAARVIDPPKRTRSVQSQALLPAAGRAPPGGPKDFEVGYRKPPKHSQFKPGQSGNPKGRPRGAKGMSTIVRDVLTAKVTVRTAEGPKKMSKMEAAFHKLAEKGFSGDVRALDKLFKLYASSIPDEQPSAAQAGLGLQPEQESAALDALYDFIRDEIRAEEQGDA